MKMGKLVNDLSEKLSKIGPLNIYNCLPQTNCEECGIATCMAFSMKLLSGDSTLNECKPLLKSENHEKLDSLRELLGDQLMKSLGWVRKLNHTYKTIFLLVIIYN